MDDLLYKKLLARIVKTAIFSEILRLRALLIAYTANWEDGYA